MGFRFQGVDHSRRFAEVCRSTPPNRHCFWELEVPQARGAQRLLENGSFHPHQESFVLFSFGGHTQLLWVSPGSVLPSRCRQCGPWPAPCWQVPEPLCVSPALKQDFFFFFLFATPDSAQGFLLATSSQVSTLAVLRGTIWGAGIEPGCVTCKASALPIVLVLRSQKRNF